MNKRNIIVYTLYENICEHSGYLLESLNVIGFKNKQICLIDRINNLDFYFLEDNKIIFKELLFLLDNLINYYQSYPALNLINNKDIDFVNLNKKITFY